MHPGFTFDVTHMNKFPKPNIGFIEVLQDEELKKRILSQITDLDNMN